MTAALPLPVDVRLMNVAAGALYAALALLALVALGLWLLRHPVFALGTIRVHGDVMHSSAATLRANVAPRLSGSFFTVDLAATRAAFEDVPWVRKAVVQREFPNRLRVTLQEHRAVAYWGPESDSTLLNSFGEVFEANPGDVEQDRLPRLVGPRAEAPAMLAMYRQLAPLFEPLDLSLEQLTISGRGSWLAELDTGAQIELGRGTPEELLARVRRFTYTLTQAAGKLGRRAESLVSADLRHSDGYAMRVRGVSTTVTDPKKP